MSAENELVDEIDEAGNVLRVVTRKQMREGKLWHRCVYILVFDSQKRIFVHLRTPTKDVFPSYWDCCVGGVLASGEDFRTGAKRELQEELGVEAALVELGPFRFTDERTRVMGMVFATVTNGPFRFQPEEVVTGAFIDRVEFKRWQTEKPFCPDGIQVWDQLGTHFVAEQLPIIGPENWGSLLGSLRTDIHADQPNPITSRKVLAESGKIALTIVLWLMLAVIAGGIGYFLDGWYLAGILAVAVLGLKLLLEPLRNGIFGVSTDSHLAD